MTAAVSLILLSVGLISRFIQYLGQAVSGDIASDVLFLLMFYRLPDFFLVIVPLAFLLSILLVYGRMSEDNEIVILMNSGISQRRLLGLTLLISIIVFLFMGVGKSESCALGCKKCRANTFKSRAADRARFDDSGTIPNIWWRI